MSDGLIVRPDETISSPSLTEFIAEHGRLPFVDDEIKPWTYKGWLLPYRIGAEHHPGVAPRYDYVARTLAAGKLLDEPLPQIHFSGEHEAAVKPGMKHLDEMMNFIGYRSTSWNAFRDIAEWLGFALGVHDEPAKLDADLQEKLYRHFNLEHWLLAPTDYLGQYLCELSHNKRGGFFPTPMHICTMMVQMTYPPGVDCRAKTSHDCAVGTGRFLLAGSNYSMRLFGQDIDGLVVLVTKINLALYAPWHHLSEAFWSDDAPAEPQPVAIEIPQPIFTTAIEQLSLFDALTVRGLDGVSAT